MKNRMYAEPEFTTDNAGRELAHVPLANREERATLYAEDYRRLMAGEWSPCWQLTNVGWKFPYVLVRALNPKGKHRTLTVARLVAQVGKGQRVSYADGNRLNLRRDNLLIHEGHARTPVEALQARKGNHPEAAPDTSGPQMFTANFREGIELSAHG